MHTTRKKNDAFKKLTKPQKRVAIAKDVLKYLKKGKFTAEQSQLDAIENAFEGNTSLGDGTGFTFNDGVRSPDKRLERIMKNIIENEGKFVP